MGGKGPKGLGLPELRQAWQAASHSWPASFSQVKGPMGATMLELKRAGWSWPSAFVFVDPAGEELKLTYWSPAFLLQRFRQAAEQGHLSRFAARLRAAGEAVGDVSLDAAKTVLAKKRLPARAKATVAAFVADGIWPRARLRQAGYDVEPVCPLCSEAEDTLFHRLWVCDGPGVLQARAKAVEAGLVRRALGAGPASLIYARGLTEGPGRLLPKACTEETAVYEEWDAVTGSWREVGHEGFFFEGAVFTDGSCEALLGNSSARAGWGIVMVSEAAEPVKRAYGPVWSPMAQTAPSAEFCAVTIANMLLRPGASSTLYVDCKAVVDAAGLPVLARLSPKRVHAGFAKQQLMDSEGVGIRAAVVKVKAHVAVSDPTLSAEEKFRAIGNDLADKAARAGRGIHQLSEGSDLVSAMACFADAVATCELAAAVLPLWPRVRCKARLPPPSRTARDRPRIGEEHLRHQLVQVGASSWRCVCCRKLVRSRGRLPGARLEACPALPAYLIELSRDQRGHEVMAGATREGFLITLCGRCGAYGCSQPILLRQPCLGGTVLPGRRAAKSRFSRGMHPDFNRSARLVATWKFDELIALLRGEQMESAA